MKYNLFMRNFYNNASAVLTYIADKIGSPYVFTAVIFSLIAWFIYGGVAGFGQGWFDAIDMTIFLVNFLMIFILQRSQNADTEAIQEKLDEVIKSLDSTDSNKAALEKKKKNGD